MFVKADIVLACLCECRPGSLDVPQRPSGAMPRTARKLRVPGSDTDASLSPNLVTKTPKERSPKVVDRRSPRGPATEVHV